LKEALKSFYGRSELILSSTTTSYSFANTDGTEVSEERCKTELTLCLIARGFTQAFASKVVGGEGGIEALERIDWTSIIDDLARWAVSCLNATPLPPLERGKAFKTILDPEAAGAFAHEVGHLLEGSNGYSMKMRNLDIAEDLRIVDDPRVPGGFGSWTWDAEGVRAQRKILLEKSVVNPLHTRWSAPSGVIPGNAKGYTTPPTPGATNIYVDSSDWRYEEMKEETSEGLLLRGVVRAEVNTVNGCFELIPEVAFRIKDREVKGAVKLNRLAANLLTLLKRVDAIGRTIHLRPSCEKELGMSEGGPFIRINGAPCV